MSSRELRIGVIGVGGRGNLVRHAHKPDEGVRVVAGADIDPKTFDKFRESFGEDVFVTDDYRKLLERDDIDAVFVCSPDFLHQEHGLAALSAGKPTYLEKPMAITIEGCDALLQTAYEKKVKLYLGHNMRHMPFVQKMKELIDAGAIGEVKTAWCRHFISYGGDAYFRDWHAERSKSTSLLLQKAAHDIDVLHWLCGGYSTRVNAMGSLMVYGDITDRHGPDEPGDTGFNPKNWPPLAQTGMHPIMDVEDVSMMHMQLDNGVLVAYQQCHFTPDLCRNYTVIGSEGRIENIGDYHPNSVIHVWNKRCDNYGDGNEVYTVGSSDGGHGGADPRIVAEFILSGARKRPI